jgi:hypothetical protein
MRGKLSPVSGISRRANRGPFGAPVKSEAAMPRDLIVDEKITWGDGQEVVAPTTASGGCFLGITVIEWGNTEGLQAAYGEFASEAKAVFPDFRQLSAHIQLPLFALFAARKQWRIFGVIVTQLQRQSLCVTASQISAWRLSARWRKGDGVRLNLFCFAHFVLPVGFATERISKNYFRFSVRLSAVPFYVNQILQALQSPLSSTIS